MQDCSCQCSSSLHNRDGQDGQQAGSSQVGTTAGRVSHVEQCIAITDGFGSNTPDHREADGETGTEEQLGNGQDHRRGP